MITSTRRTVKQSTTQVLMLFLFGALVIGLIVPSLMKNDAHGAATWIIKVNGKEISYKTFLREVQMQSNLLTHIRQQYGSIADMLLQSMNMPTDPKTGAFDKLVKQELLDQYVDTLNIEIHPSYVSECISNATFAQQYLGIPPFVYDTHGVIQKDILENYLKQQALSAQEFEQSIEQSLKRYHALRLIFSTNYIPEFDVTQNYISYKLGKQFSYLHFSLDSFLNKEKKHDSTLEELQSFFDAENNQRRRYFVPEKRNGFMWKFEPSSYGITISDDEIEQYYQANKVRLYSDKPMTVYTRQITAKQLEGTDQTIESVRDEIMQHGTSSKWAHKWVDLEPIMRNEKNGVIEKTALLLKNDGDISSIVETENGKSILQLIKRVPRTYKSLAMVKSDIAKTLTDKKFKTLFVKDLKKGVMSGDLKAIEHLIAEKKGKKEHLENIEKGSDKVSQELFSLKKDDYAVFIEGSVGIVIQLTKKADRYLPTLDSIKDIVQNDLHQKQAHNALITLVKQAQEAAGQGKSFDELQLEFSVPLETTEMIKPNDTKKIKQLEKKELPISMLLNLEKIGSLVVHHAKNDSFLIKVDAIESFDQEAFLLAKKEIKDQIERMHVGQIQEAIVASLHKNATIETNNSLFIPSEEYSE